MPRIRQGRSRPTRRPSPDAQWQQCPPTGPPPHRAAIAPVAAAFRYSRSARIPPPLRVPPRTRTRSIASRRASQVLAEVRVMPVPALPRGRRRLPAPRRLRPRRPRAAARSRRRSRVCRRVWRSALRRRPRAARGGVQHVQEVRHRRRRRRRGPAAVAAAAVGRRRRRPPRRPHRRRRARRRRLLVLRPVRSLLLLDRARHRSDVELVLVLVFVELAVAEARVGPPRLRVEDPREATSGRSSGVRQWRSRKASRYVGIVSEG